MAYKPHRLTQKHSELNPNQTLVNDVLQTSLSPVLLLSPRTFSLGRIPQVGMWAGGIGAMVAGGPLAPLGLAMFGISGIMNRMISRKQTQKYQENQFTKEEQEIIKEYNQTMLSSKRLEAVHNNLHNAYEEMADMNKQAQEILQNGLQAVPNMQAGQDSEEQRQGSGIAAAGSGSGGANDAKEDFTKTFNQEGLQQRENLLQRIEQFENNLNALAKSHGKMKMNFSFSAEARAYRQMQQNIEVMKEALASEAKDPKNVTASQSEIEDMQSRLSNSFNKSVHGSMISLDKKIDNHKEDLAKTAVNRYEKIESLKEDLQTGSAVHSVAQGSLSQMSLTSSKHVFNKASAHNPEMVNNPPESIIGIPNYFSDKSAPSQLSPQTSPA